MMTKNDYRGAYGKLRHPYTVQPARKNRVVLAFVVLLLIIWMGTK